jgi:hypothetical protein
MLSLTGPDDPNFETRLQEELKRKHCRGNTVIQQDLWSLRGRSGQIQGGGSGNRRGGPLSRIILADQSEADAVQKQISDSADFAQVAGEVSRHNSERERGRSGWAPRYSRNHTGGHTFRP